MPFALAFALLAAQPVTPDPQEVPAAEGDFSGVDWEKEFGVEKKVADPVTGEFPVEPYQQGPANAGAGPFTGESMARAFGGQDGIHRIVDRLVVLSESDPRISAIFKSRDLVRLRRTLFEQFCFILNAGCIYSGREMKAAHKDLGITRADLNALVENLQQAMREGQVPFAAQNRFLAKLAPMDRQIVER